MLSAMHEVRNRRADISIKVELGKGQVSGPVGAVDKAQVDAGSLFSAVNEAKTLEVKSQ